MQQSKALHGLLFPCHLKLRNNVGEIVVGVGFDADSLMFLVNVQPLMKFLIMFIEDDSEILFHSKPI